MANSAQASDNVGYRTDDLLRQAVFVATALVEACLLAKLFMLPTADAALVAAIVLMAGLLLLAPRVFDIVSMKLGGGELSAQLQARIEETNARVDRLFLLAMSGTMYENLRKLATGTFGEFTKNSGLDRELHTLRDAGYIEVPAIAGIPQSGANLSDHVRVTPVGMDFVREREALLLRE